MKARKMDWLYAIACFILCGLYRTTIIAFAYLFRGPLHTKISCRILPATGDPFIQCEFLRVLLDPANQRTG
jgi:hypothetical protein